MMGIVFNGIVYGNGYYIGATGNYLGANGNLGCRIDNGSSAGRTALQIYYGGIGLATFSKPSTTFRSMVFGDFDSYNLGNMQFRGFTTYGSGFSDSSGYWRAYAQDGFTGGGATATFIPRWILNPNGVFNVFYRFGTAKGVDVASANDLTLGLDGNIFHITGTTQINAITTANWQAGSEITLIFDSTPTVKNNTAGGGGTAVMLLQGGADFSATANVELP